MGSKETRVDAVNRGIYGFKFLSLFSTFFEIQFLFFVPSSGRNLRKELSLEWRD